MGGFYAANQVGNLAKLAPMVSPQTPQTRLLSPPQGKGGAPSAIAIQHPNPGLTGGKKQRKKFGIGGVCIYGVVGECD